jgi:hypothetical protein
MKFFFFGRLNAEIVIGKSSGGKAVKGRKKEGRKE